MNRPTITVLTVLDLQTIARDATDMAIGTLRDIVRPHRSFLFHDSEDVQSVALARHWLAFAQACGSVIEDIATATTDSSALDEAIIGLHATDTATDIQFTTPSPEMGPHWRITFPANPDLLGIDIVSLLTDNGHDAV